MRSVLVKTGLCAGIWAAAGAARGDLTYQLQDRSISATTSANMNTQAVAAPGFGPFVANLDLATTFVTPAGTTGANEARVGIDCQLDPNAIRVFGSLGGAGGLSVVGGNQVLQFGEAAARVDTDFRATQPTPFRMIVSPRPSTRPGDRFKVKLKNETTNVILFYLDETMPPQAVDFSGVFDLSDMSLEFEVQLMVDGPETLAGFLFNLTLGDCYANCDRSTTQPTLNINDFICFLNRFAAADPYANCDLSTTPPVLNVLDFICFLNRFAAGCS